MKFTTAAVVVASLLIVVAPEAETLPTRVVDSHHHFLDFANNEFSSWLGGMFGNLTYLPEDYNRDVVEPLAQEGVELTGSVHLEILPDTPFGGVEEAKWIQSMVDAGRSKVKAIVGSCDLGDENTQNVEDCLSQIIAASPLLRGIRWILDYVGPHDGTTATHLNAIRKDMDYLRGGAEGTVVPSFETGYAMLEKYGWSFDAQLAPEQLPAMANLASRYPNIPVIINHLGKPRHVLGLHSNNTQLDEQALDEWRTWMKLMADAHPNTYVKLSMLGYAVPDWILDEKRVEVVKNLVLEAVEIFGPKRSMFGLNWFLGHSISDNDGLGTVGPSPVEYTKYMSEWLKDYSDEDRDWIFAKTAEEVYKIDTGDGPGGIDTEEPTEPTETDPTTVGSTSAGFAPDKKRFGGVLRNIIFVAVVGILVAIV